MASALVKQSGFTLLEAMVAIIVLTMTMMAAYGWVNVNIRTLLRSDEVLVEELLVSDLLTELELTDLNEVTSGTINRNDLQLYWQAEQIELKSSVSNVGSSGFYDYALFDVRVELQRNQELIATYQTRAFQAELVREPVFEQ